MRPTGEINRDLRRLPETDSLGARSAGALSFSLAMPKKGAGKLGRRQAERAAGKGLPPEPKELEAPPLEAKRPRLRLDNEEMWRRVW